MSPRSGPDPARRNERSRHAILAAAMELLAETGYADLTIEAIAARAGVGKQTIYRWWPGKGAIILDAMADPAVIRDAALPDTGDVRADLYSVIRSTVAELADPHLSAVSRALTIETLAHDALAEQVRERLLRPHLDAIKDRLRSAQRAGQLRPDVDLDQAVELLIGPPYHRWMLRTGPLTERYADTVVDLALAALAPPVAG
ncbi:MAG TPA: TetR/AcrR family transcriptional regulator [Pseudonocardia sp.]|nr:TetR/AcrR family transcriptional regulator [Pseudonocardia sp.]